MHYIGSRVCRLDIILLIIHMGKILVLKKKRGKIRIAILLMVFSHTY